MRLTFFTVLLISIIQTLAFCQIITTVEFNCDIFADSNLTRKTYTLKKYDTVRVNSYHFKADAYLIIHNNMEGYVYSRKLKNTSGLTVMKRNAILAVRNSQKIENKKINKELMGSRPKNNAYVNLFGDASTISVNYERLAFISPSFFLAGKLGIGFRFEEALPYGGDFFWTLPYHITGNLGTRKHFLELGMGMTTDLTSTKTFFPNIKTKTYFIVGYRFQPTKPNVRIIGRNYFFRFNLLYFTKEGYPSMVPIGISLGKSF